MSVYTELIRLGVHEDTAREIDEAVYRSTAIVTTDVLDARVAALDARLAAVETRMVRTIHTSMIAMTGIFAVFVAAMAWVVK